MKGQLRNIYPGGNTPKGFHSYYNYILPQRKAEKIFCIKGGPGTGKSTLMKSVAEHFLQQEEAVDLLWCSSDPASLDGILLRERGVALVDGTAPHIVDPKNPGAVDEIINLGDCWDEAGIRQHRRQIIDCNERIGRTFETAYGYLACAEAQYRFMARILERLISRQQLRELQYQMHIKLDSISAVKRAEHKLMRDMAMGNEIRIGEVKKAFAGAISPAGMKNEIPSIIAGAEKIILMEAPAGYRTEKLLAPVSKRLIAAGMDVEEYYCPMRPEEGLEHIFCGEASLAVVTCNPFHDVSKILAGKKVMEVKVFPEDKDGELEIWNDLQEGSRRNIIKALEVLEQAKVYHDELESYYVPYMDFEKTEEAATEIIGKIEDIVVQ